MIGDRHGGQVASAGAAGAVWGSAAGAACAAVAVLLCFGLAGALVVANVLSDRHLLRGLDLFRVAAGLAVAGLHGTVNLSGGFAGTVPPWQAFFEPTRIGFPLLLPGVGALVTLARSAWRRGRAAPVPSFAAACRFAVRAGVLFAAVVVCIAAVAGGDVDGTAGGVSWRFDLVRAGWWALLLGTAAAWLGATAAHFAGPDGPLRMTRLSAVKRGWLRAVAGTAVACGAMVALTLAVAVALGMVGLFWAPDWAPEPVRDWLGRHPSLGVLGLVLVLPVLAADLLGIACGGVLTAAPWLAGGVGIHLGQLSAGRPLPAIAWSLLAIPLAGGLIGGRWTAKREWADPEPVSGVSLRTALLTGTAVGAGIVLAQTTASGFSVLVGTPDSGAFSGSFTADAPAEVGVGPFTAACVAFASVLLCGYLAERRAARRRSAARSVAHLWRAPRLVGRRAWPAILLGLLTAMLVLATAVAAALPPPATPVASPAPTTASTLPASTGPADPTIPTDPTVPAADPVELAGQAVATASDTAPPSHDDQGREVDFDAGNVLDGDVSTAWRVEGVGKGHYLEFEFAAPVRLTAVGLLPGYAKTDPASGRSRFKQNRRVLRARWRFDDGSSVEQPFEDVAEIQMLPVAVETSRVQVEILSTRPPTGSQPRAFTAVSEVSLQGTPASASG